MRRLSILLLALLLGGCVRPVLPAAPSVSPVLVPAASAGATATVRPLPDAGGEITAVAYHGARLAWLARGRRLAFSSNGGADYSPLAALASPVQQLDFVSPEQGWAATAAGLYATRDGGRTWAPVALRGGDRVDFFDAAHGWAGAGEALFASSDGGATWTALTSPCGGDDRRATFSLAGPETGYLLCSGQPATAMSAKRLYRSDDGGRRWTLEAATPRPGGDGSESQATAGVLPMSGHAAEMYFRDADHGWLSLLRSGLLATADGGRTWQLLTGPGLMDTPPRDLRFLTPQQGFARFHLGGRALVAQTGDGGRTWTELYPALAPASHATLAPIDAGRAVAVGSPLSPGAVLTTADGGRTWQQVGLLPGEAVVDLSFPDADHGWAVVERWEESSPVRALYRTRDGGATWTALPRTYTDLKDAYATVSFVDADTGYLASGWGHLYVTGDGGLTVQPVDIADSHSSGYRFVSRREGWKIDDFTLYTTADGGRSWSPADLDYRAWQVAPLPGGRAWLLAGECRAGACRAVLLSTADAGRAWTRHELGDLQPIQVRFADAAHGWLTDADGALFTTADAGTTWTQVR